MLSTTYKGFSWLLILLMLLTPLMAQQGQFQRQTYGRQDFPRSDERYITDEFGVIRMWVNVMGHVKIPGSHLVYDGIDMATLMAITGGPKPGANLKEVRVFRDIPDTTGNISYTINMDKFYELGDRRDFIPVFPNDTYVIPQTTTSYVLSHVGLINTVLSALNIYYLVLIRQEQAKD